MDREIPEGIAASSRGAEACGGSEGKPKIKIEVTDLVWKNEEHGIEVHTDDEDLGKQGTIRIILPNSVSLTAVTTLRFATALIEAATVAMGRKESQHLT